MRIVFVIPSLGPGGAEKVASLLCNCWSSKGHATFIVTFEAAGEQPFHDLRSEIQTYRLNARSKRSHPASRITINATRISRLRKLLKQLRPDVVVAFMTDANVIATCAALGSRVPVVISERNQPDRPGLGIPHRLARMITYPLADAIVVQTKQIAGWMKRRVRTPVVVIPNPVLLKQDRTATVDVRSDSANRQIVSVGRLTRQKGYDILIRSFASLASRYPDWALVIYGEGLARTDLERLIEDNRLRDRVRLPGIRKAISEALAEADLFVMPSRYEGYPNALLEALASGLPVIATDCPGANAEILDKGRYGMLIPADDVSALAAAMDAMMSSPHLRQTFALRAGHAVAGLDIEAIGTRWLEQLDLAIRNRKRTVQDAPPSRS